MSWEGDMFCAVCGGRFGDLEFAEPLGIDESWDSDYVSEGSYEDDTSMRAKRLGTTSSKT